MTRTETRYNKKPPRYGAAERRNMTVNGCEIVKNAEVYGINESVRAAKFPMAVEVGGLSTELTPGIKALAQAPIGEGHDNFLLGVVVQFDLTATNKFWVEMERYHFADIISSQSTMHRIARFDLDMGYIPYVDPRIVEIMKEKVAEYNAATEEDKPELYLGLLYSNPAGFKLTARMTTNYRQLKTIYRQRKNHRLKEWRDFCAWIETLPEAELIIGEKEHG